MDPRAEPLLGGVEPARPPAWATLACCYSIFFTQYAISLMISPFFPTSPAGTAIGGVMVGAVFAAYSLAVAVATPLPPLAMRHLGTRHTVALGLSLAAAGSLCFGLLPSLLSSSVGLASGMLCCRMLSGVGAALSESACLTIISTLGTDDSKAGGGGGDGDGNGGGGGHLGFALSSVEVFTGVGAAAGAAVGGALYQLGDATPFGAFLFPFVVAGASLLLLVPVLLAALPPSRTRLRVAPLSPSTPATRALRARAAWLRRLPTIVSLVACAGTCEALSPILSPQMRARFGMAAPSRPKKRASRPQTKGRRQATAGVAPVGLLPMGGPSFGLPSFEGDMGGQRTAEGGGARARAPATAPVAAAVPASTAVHPCSCTSAALATSDCVLLWWGRAPPPHSPPPTAAFSWCFVGG